MIPPHLFYQIYLSFLEQNDCTPPKCGELSEYTDRAHTEVEDPSSKCMNGSNVYDRCGHDTRLLHPSCTACRRTANLPGLAWQNEACSRPHHSSHLAKWKRYIDSVVERKIAQWVHPMKDRSDDPSHHEQTLLPRSYISLLGSIGEIIQGIIQCSGFN